jgi:hypothetical protein
MSRLSSVWLEGSKTVRSSKRLELLRWLKQVVNNDAIGYRQLASLRDKVRIHDPFLHFVFTRFGYRKLD